MSNTKHLRALSNTSVYLEENSKFYQWVPKGVCLHESGHAVVGGETNGASKA